MDVSMNDHAANVNTWTQLSLLPPAEVIVIVKIQVDNQAASNTLSIKVTDAHDGQLIGMRVWPMRDQSTWMFDLAAVVLDLESILGALIEPF